LNDDARENFPIPNLKVLAGAIAAVRAVKVLGLAI
jgi:hypothetical protein